MDAPPDGHNELDLPVQGVGLGRLHDVVVRADQGVGELREQRGYDGGSPPIFSMWFASFCPTQITFDGFGMTGVKSAPSIG